MPGGHNLRVMLPIESRRAKVNQPDFSILDSPDVSALLIEEIVGINCKQMATDSLFTFLGL